MVASPNGTEMTPQWFCKFRCNVHVRSHFVPVGMWSHLREAAIPWVPSSRLTTFFFAIKFRPRAEVAELADALRSGRSEGSLMWVQVPPSASQETTCPSGRLFLFHRGSTPSEAGVGAQHVGVQRRSRSAGLCPRPRSGSLPSRSGGSRSIPRGRDGSA